MSSDSQPDIFFQQRERMVLTQLRARGIRDERVLSAMERVPRQEFVAPEFRHDAYEDHPLPIGEQQTISQPYIVALMLEYLAIEPQSTVLEIGTGSGYQTALLAELAGHVYSIERHWGLADSAAQVLARLEYRNITIKVGDGSQGLAEHAPFDRIIVSAAAQTVPAPLFEQLREGGRMIVPVGSEQAQELQLVVKQNGLPVKTSLEGCRFVPLVAGAPKQDLQ